MLFDSQKEKIVLHITFYSNPRYLYFKYCAVNTKNRELSITPISPTFELEILNCKVSGLFCIRDI